jgi:hypothetical protein
MLLRILRGVTLSAMTVHGPAFLPLPPLNDGQQRILAWLALPLETFSRIVPPLSNPAYHSRET